MRLKEIKTDMVIHCKTKGEVSEVFKVVKENGFSIDIWDGKKENTCLRISDGVLVGFDCVDYYTNDGYTITEFSDLIIPELSAKEVLETMKEICKHHDCQCHRCSFRGNCDPTEDSSDKIIDICTKWREEHPKEEKKELETEWVYVVRIIKVHENGKKECVHEVDGYASSDDVDSPFSESEELAERELKDYVANHEGNFFATLEHICRIKE